MTSRNLSHPAQRAALLMMLIALLLAGMGGLVAVMRHLLVTAPLPPELQSQIHQVESQLHLPFMVFLHAVSTIMLGMALVVGVLCAWVRRGTLLPIVLSLIVDAMALLFIGISILGALAALVTMGGPQVLASLSVWIVALAIAGLLFGWLLQAAKLARVQQPMATTEPIEQFIATPSRGMGYGAFSPPPRLPKRENGT